MEHPECINWALLPRALLGLVALLCGNGYIVGINQIYDVDIDVVNKPFLPVASGEHMLQCCCGVHPCLDPRCDPDGMAMLSVWRMLPSAHHP